MAASAEAQLTQDKIRDTVRRIVASNTFASSERLIRFLEFSCEQALAGKGSELKEQVLAIEVFGRDPSYDPKTNSLVRVTALKLRSKLIEYYAAEGAPEPVRIELPKGSYVPVFHIAPTVETEKPPNPSPRRQIYVAAFIVGVLAIALAGFLWLRPRVDSPDSIAVLPFVNMTGDAKNDVFTDGVTEEVIDALTKVPNLNVVARTSAFQFKAKQIDIREVGRKLAVDAVLEGSVRRMDNRWRITAQLNRVSDGYHLWSETYDRELNDIFGIQEHVARAIVSKMHGSGATTSTPGLFTRQPSSDPMVYSLYLQGRQYVSMYTPKAYETAIGFFEQALARDPRYAPAYVGLADCYFLLGPAQFGNRRREDTVPLVRSLLAKAIDIDPGLGEAHVVLGRLLAEYEWNFPEAEREFRRAIELTPGAVRAHMRYGVFLSFSGRFKEGIDELRKAIRLDPLPSEPRVHLATALYLSRRYEDALKECRSTLELNPRAAGAYLTMGLAEGAKENYDAAVTALQNSLEISGGKVSIGLVGAVGYAQGRGGKVADARQTLQWMLDEYQKRPYTSPMYIARVYLGLGDTEKVFEFLEKGYEYHDPQMLWLKCDPRFDPIRGDSRYASLIKRMNL